MVYFGLEPGEQHSKEICRNELLIVLEVDLKRNFGK